MQNFYESLCDELETKLKEAELKYERLKKVADEVVFWASRYCELPSGLGLTPFIHARQAYERSTVSKVFKDV